MEVRQSFRADIDKCVPVQQRSQPVTVSINSQGNSAEIRSPVKDHMTVNVDDHSTAEPNSESKSSCLVPYEASSRDLIKNIGKQLKIASSGRDEGGGQQYVGGQHKTSENFMTCANAVEFESNRQLTFFDSQTWLESDCDDFLSIDGDFAPSCGSSPTFHQASFAEAPQYEQSFCVGSAAKATSEPSPKQLIDLFGESFSNYLDATDSNHILKDRKGANKPITFYLPTKWTSRRRETPETTPAGCFNTRKEQSARPVKCCFPGLGQSFRFCERKKKLSPAYNGGL